MKQKMWKHWNKSLCWNWAACKTLFENLLKEFSETEESPAWLKLKLVATTNHNMVQIREIPPFLLTPILAWLWKLRHRRQFFQLWMLPTSHAASEAINSGGDDKVVSQATINDNTRTDASALWWERQSSFARYFASAFRSCACHCALNFPVQPNLICLLSLPYRPQPRTRLDVHPKKRCPNPLHLLRV